MVHHAVHAATDGKEHSRASQLLEIPQVVAPVGLRENGHPQALVFKKPCHYGVAKAGVIHIGVGANDNHVHVIPT